jgi:hypothetical protein
MNNDSSGAFELAMLAAQLCPDLCKTEPEKALDAAGKLLGRALLRAEKGKLNLKWYTETLKRNAARLAEPLDYKEVVKDVTGESKKMFPHRQRAEEGFVKFWAHKHGIPEKVAKHQLAAYKSGKKQFTRGEKIKLREEFLEWRAQPRKLKGKQGRVKNPEEDDRKKARPAAMRSLRKAFYGAIPDESV